MATNAQVASNDDGAALAAIGLALIDQARKAGLEFMADAMLDGLRDDLGCLTINPYQIDDWMRR